MTERGDEGVARIKEMTGGLGAHSVCRPARRHAGVNDAVNPCGAARRLRRLCRRAARRAGSGPEYFFSHVHLHGGPARFRYLPTLIDLILQEEINPGKVFDQTLPLAQVAEGYRAMDKHHAIKTLLRP